MSDSVFGPLTPAEQRELAMRLFHEQPENMPLGEKCWNIARELNARLGFVRWDSDKVKKLHDRDQWSTPQIGRREDLQEIVHVISADERLEDALLHRLERAGLDAFMNLERLLMLVPEWLRITNPADWSTADGLKAVKLVPDYMKSLAAFIEDLERLRVAMAKDINGAEVINPQMQPGRKISQSLLDDALGRMASQNNQVQSLMKH